MLRNGDDRRQQLIATARSFLGVRFGHQGRSRLTGMDCGGLVMVSARASGITTLEFLGYADFPTEGKFDELLEQEAVKLFTRIFPFAFDGTELGPADLLSFNYGNGEGTRHLALVTGWDGRRYRVIEAQPDRGVTEHALAPPFVRAGNILTGWRIRGIDDPD